MEANFFRAAASHPPRPKLPLREERSSQRHRERNVQAEPIVGAEAKHDPKSQKPPTERKAQ